MTAEPDETESEGLLAVASPSAAHLAALRRRLVARASESGLLDIAYRFIDTPVGRLLLVASQQGLIRVAYQNEDFAAVLDTIGLRVSPRVLHTPGRLDPAARQLDEYFGGTRRRFDVPLDLQLTEGFRGRVVAYLPVIGYGHTATYGDVAAALHHPRAARAVGTACATNPLPLFLPCHRVIRSDGRIGAYLGGEETKRRLLSMENAAAAQRSRSR